MYLNPPVTTLPFHKIGNLIYTTKTQLEETNTTALKYTWKCDQFQDRKPELET